MMISILSAAALGSLVQTVAPQTAPQTPPPASVLKNLEPEKRPPPAAADITAARAQADSIANTAHAADIFDNVTTTGSPALRHKASGLVCTFTYGSSINQILVFHEPRGDSIGCNTGRGKMSISIFLDRAPPARPPVESLIGPLAAAIVKRLPDAKPSGPVMIASGKDNAGADLPPHKVAQFTRPTPNGAAEERLAVGYAGAWLLQQRVTEPAADSIADDLVNEISFLSIQTSILSGMIN